MEMLMSDKMIAVIGGDRRFSYLAEELKKDGFNVGIIAGEGEKADIDAVLSDSFAAVLPFPVSPDGVYLNAPYGGEVRLSYLFEKIKAHGVGAVLGGAVSPAVTHLAESYGLNICDYGKMETVALKNALCTSEGAIRIALENLPITLHSSRVTVLGYGRIGRILAVMLKRLGASVSAVARKSEDIAKMQIDGIEAHVFSSLKEAVCGRDLIFNTVPYPVMTEDVLSVLSGTSLVIDLASAPGGVDRDAARRLGVNVIWALSLPGKTAPKTAAAIIKEAVLTVLEL